MEFSSNSFIDEAYLTTSDTFASNRTKPLSWRIDQLRKTWWMMEDNKERIADALHRDMNKHRQEALSVDAAGVQTACLEALKHIKTWTADDKPNRLDPLNFFGGARIRKEPKGVALIISAWNYPFMELIEPMICAIAAGCTVVLKPSELSVACQDLIAEIVPKYLDQDAIRVVTAGPEGMNHILTKKWDHIFFTGSTVVGKIIYTKAAANLTTVTLELGGKGPAIVTKNANVDLAAKRIAFTKVMNAGQICLGVNHVFVDPSVKEQFLASLYKYFDEFLPESSKKPSYYSQIINERNFNRLDGLLQRSSGKIVYGGQRDVNTLHFHPTIVDGVSTSDSLMTEELFGPILPILDGTLDEAIAYTAKYDHPLALYGFTQDQAEMDKILNQTASGGVTLNDCLLHMTVKGAPFGGVGGSGMGSYHGPYGFKEFTHLRTVVNVPGWLEVAFKMRYPPYTDKSAAEMIKYMGPVTKVPFDRNGKDTTTWLGRVAKLLAKSVIAVVLIAFAKGKGWLSLGWVDALKARSAK
ncbi:putative aldehyde dehydrogenase [Dactylonectria macrodidyma]|uniref:Aldehyde dehydrogenase n=1 Tax=Dactylonectria macrodidyma TaxID=307937 RepID=A0A9P9IKV4_9HYPO|nr:putative aldehyde dehydrogenase [Dactylonectria macrodidyma]